MDDFTTTVLNIVLGVAIFLLGFKLGESSERSIIKCGKIDNRHEYEKCMEAEQ